MSTRASYIIGFALSVAITLAAFYLYQLHLYTQHVFPTHEELRIAFVILAVSQIFVQLAFFLHVGRGQDKTYNAIALSFALFIVVVLVGGSLWIMANLNQNAAATGTYINNLVNVQNEED